MISKIGAAKSFTISLTPRMASHRRGVGWFRSRSEGRKTEARLDFAGHRSPEVEWNRSRPADTTTLAQLHNRFLKSEQ